MKMKEVTHENLKKALLEVGHDPDSTEAVSLMVIKLSEAGRLKEAGAVLASAIDKIKSAKGSQDDIEILQHIGQQIYIRSGKTPAEQFSHKMAIEGYACLLALQEQEGLSKEIAAQMMARATKAALAFGADGLKAFIKSLLSLAQGNYEEMGRSLNSIARALPDDLDFCNALRLMVGQQVFDGNVADIALWSARWIQCNRPTLYVSTEELTGCAWNDYYPEDFLDLKSPWPAWEMTFPDEAFPVILTKSDLSGLEGKHFVKRIAVSSHQGTAAALFPQAPDKPKVVGDDVWRIRVDVGQHGLWSVCGHLPDLVASWAPDEHDVGGVEFLDVSETNCVALAVRAAIGALIKMKESAPRRLSSSQAKNSKIKAFRFGSRPFRLTSTIRFKDADEVHKSFCEYSMGTGRKAKVRWCVRGHWRNQVFGPKNSLRRRTWIPPHMAGKGPELDQTYTF